MQQTLIVIGGGLNVLFGLLHIGMGWEFHHATRLLPADRALVEMLNVSTALLVFFFAYASFFSRQELLTTALGKTVLVLVLLMYLSRAIEEVVLSPAFSAAIFGACFVVGLDRQTYNPERTRAQSVAAIMASMRGYVLK